LPSKTKVIGPTIPVGSAVTVDKLVAMESNERCSDSKVLSSDGNNDDVSLSEVKQPEGSSETKTKSGNI